MKKFLCIAIVIVLCSLSLGASAEFMPMGDTVIGSVEDFNQSMYMYCYMWNDRYGSLMDADISYDPAKVEYLDMAEDKESYSAALDGVIVDLNFGLNVVSARVPVTGNECSHCPAPAH